ncbi:hypothetical protein HRbin40_01344 [bacterium HR40]|nr:hypothetical protein HRbin40_01344 [bacterium HR40]
MLRAEDIRRGVERLLAAHGLVSLAEFPLPCGRRLDLLALDRSGRFVAVEIKTTLQDFRSDHKWGEYLPWADRFAFAVPIGFPVDCLPPQEGVVIADRFEAAWLREARERPLAPARRRALLLRFARVAARRLQGNDGADPRDDG